MEREMKIVVGKGKKGENIKRKMNMEREMVLGSKMEGGIGRGIDRGNHLVL